MRRFVISVLATSLLWVLTTPVQAQPEIVLGLWPQSYAQFLEIEAARGSSSMVRRARLSLLR